MLTICFDQASIIAPEPVSPRRGGIMCDFDSNVQHLKQFRRTLADATGLASAKFLSMLAKRPCPSCIAQLGAPFF
jgi:hypothetical protein